MNTKFDSEKKTMKLMEQIAPDCDGAFVTSALETLIVVPCDKTISKC